MSLSENDIIKDTRINSNIIIIHSFTFSIFIIKGMRIFIIRRLTIRLLTILFWRRKTGVISIVIYLQAFSFIISSKFIHCFHSLFGVEKWAKEKPNQLRLGFIS